MPTGEIIRDEAYIKWLRDQPCLLTGFRANPAESVVPMHLGTGGKGIKTSDAEAIPVLNSLHSLGHSKGEISMLRQHAPEWLLREAFRAYAREQYAKYLDEK